MKNSFHVQLKILLGKNILAELDKLKLEQLKEAGTSEKGLCTGEA